MSRTCPHRPSEYPSECLRHFRLSAIRSGRSFGLRCETLYPYNDGAPLPAAKCRSFISFYIVRIFKPPCFSAGVLSSIVSPICDVNCINFISTYCIVRCSLLSVKLCFRANCKPRSVNFVTWLLTRITSTSHRVQFSCFFLNIFKLLDLRHDLCAMNESHSMLYAHTRSNWGLGVLLKMNMGFSLQ